MEPSTQAECSQAVHYRLIQSRGWRTRRDAKHSPHPLKCSFRNADPCSCGEGSPCRPYTAKVIKTIRSNQENQRSLRGFPNTIPMAAPRSATFAVIGLADPARQNENPGATRLVVSTLASFCIPMRVLAKWRDRPFRRSSHQRAEPAQLRSFRGSLGNRDPWDDR